MALAAGWLLACPVWGQAESPLPVLQQDTTKLSAAEVQPDTGTAAAKAAQQGQQQGTLIRGMDITGSSLLKGNDLLRLIQIRPGMTVDADMVRQAAANVDAQYNAAGYLFSRVTSASIDSQGILHMGITEGRVEDVSVKGNIKSKTNVVTREMVIHKGDIFNSNLVRRSIQRLYNTGYFGEVNVQLFPGQQDPHNVRLEVDVDEQKTGLVTFGAGYSQSNGIVGIIGLSDSNFRGRGDQVGLNWEFGGSAHGNNYTFSYTHPWVNAHGDSLGFSVFDHNYDYDDYNQDGNSVAEYYKRTKGFNVTYGRAHGQYIRDYLTLETKRVNYDEYQSGYDYREVPGYLKSNFGRTNSLSWSHVYDNRDNVFNPTRGRRIATTTTVAGHGMGGDFSFYKLMTEGSWYRDMGHSHVLALRLMGGLAFGGDVPYSELFSLGGADTMRGYEDDEFRGSRYYIGTLEYRIPLTKKLQAVLFADAGSAWNGTDKLFWYEGDNKIHYDGGAGLRIQTPIGRVRLDYGWGSNGGKFHFSFGGQF
jgi:outer membrane protein insertion porin family